MNNEIPFDYGDKLSLLAIPTMWIIKWIGLVDLNTVLSIITTAVVMGYNLHKWYDYAKSKNKKSDKKV